MRRLLAWFRRQIAPTVPPPRPRAGPSDDTPMPTRRFVLSRCPGCNVMVVTGVYHDCKTPRADRAGGHHDGGE
jgi:hypothetical protein